MSFNFLSKTGQFANGLVGTVGYTVYKPDGTEQTVRTTAGIVAIGAVGYAAVVSLPSDGAYVIQWDDGSAHYDYDSPPIAIMADGGAHGGAPGSSTATFALQKLVVAATSTDTAVVFQGGNSGGHGFACLGSGISIPTGYAAGMVLKGATSSPGLNITAGNGGDALDIMPDTAGGFASIYVGAVPASGGGACVYIDGQDAPAFLAKTTAADVIQLLAAGTGKKAILLSGAAATDVLAIAAGAGTPIDIFDNTGAVRTTGGGGGPVTLDLTQVVPTTNTPQTVGDALNVTRPVTVDLTQVIPTTNTEQTIGDALNAARSMGFGGLSINKIAKTLTLFAPNGTTPVHVFNLDNVSSPTSRT